MGMAGNSKTKSKYSSNDFSGDKADKPIPAGCKKYYFNKNGGYNTVWDTYTVFICTALNFKSAKKKFIKWETNKK